MADQEHERGTEPSGEDSTVPSVGDRSVPSEPARIGPYKIIRRIGEGGMGVVYEAEQETPIRRKVALKLVKWGMDTKQVIARFEAERQALAMMSHPNIATVFDAGATETGRPYFVMEHIKGVPFTEYCDTQRLALPERIGLFVQFCRAVDHAHSRGVIHRDLKPSNLLIEIKDGQPVPKIIDFGVAKATDHRLTERTVFTEFGQLIGTPEYMSPEQAEMSALEVDARTDVYSLGVVLYEVLSGMLPFPSSRLREAGYARIQRIIREENPPTPSACIAGRGDGADEILRSRQSDARALRRTLRGDLDWIVMKALRKDRTRRYGSPNELARDLERYLRAERVAPGPAWLRNDRWMSAGAPLALAAIPGIVGVVLILGSLGGQLERRGLDLLFQMRGANPTPKDVCIAALDDDSFKVMGRDSMRRWPRGRHADLVRTLKREGARAIAFDILFLDAGSDPKGDAAFAQALADAGNVVLGAATAVTGDPEPHRSQRDEPYEPFGRAAAAVADVNLAIDPDGVIRFQWPTIEGRAGLSLAAYEVATGDNSQRASDPRLIDYYGPPRTIQTVSLYQALDPQKYLPHEFFKDKIVFVGLSRNASVWGAQREDAFLTPFSGKNGAMSSVEVHATLAANLIEGRQIRVIPQAAEVAFLLLLPIPILFANRSIGLAVFVGLEVLVVVTAAVAFSQAGVWLPLIIPGAIQLPLAFLIGLLRAYGPRPLRRA